MPAQVADPGRVPLLGEVVREIGGQAPGGDRLAGQDERLQRVQPQLPRGVRLGAQPGRLQEMVYGHLRRSRRGLLPGGLGQLGGQRGVGDERGRGALFQRGRTVEIPGRPAVQRDPVGRAQAVEHGGPDQVVDEADLVPAGFAAVLDQAGGHGRVQRPDRVVELCHLRGQGEPGGAAEHGHCRGQALELGGTGGEPALDEPREGTGRRQRSTGPGQELRVQLAQQRHRVQGETTGVGTQAPRGGLRQRHPVPGGELGHLRYGEPGQSYRLPAQRLDEPGQRLAPGVERAGTDHGQYGVGLQPAQCEAQRVQRRRIGPLGVVEDEDGRAGAGTEGP